MKLVGYEERSGRFEAEGGRVIDYDNFLLHLIGTFDPTKNGIGEETSILKVNRAIFERISGAHSPAQMLGNDLELGYTLSGGKPVLCSISVR